ncbi:MAG TPA: hypothetical protein VGI70_13860, partial [Polyangiales bacterium]
MLFTPLTLAPTELKSAALQRTMPRIMSQAPLLPPLARRVFANRTINLRAIKAIGCDMDYTL